MCLIAYFVDSITRSKAGRVREAQRGETYFGKVLT
jgi:hypothetical protein